MGWRSHSRGPPPPPSHWDGPQDELFDWQRVRSYALFSLRSVRRRPFLFVSESVALAPRVDGVVTVVRASSNSRGLLQRLRDTLRQLKAEHLGVVLNAVRAQGGGYYGRNIKTYYEYQNGHAA